MFIKHIPALGVTSESVTLAAMRTLLSCFVPRWSVAIALAVAVSQSPAFARAIPVVPPDGIISGPARVIDGDTIDIAGTRIRLEGIDAPEAGQTCQTATAQSWACGTEATRLMVAMTEQRVVDCHASGLDKYGRVLGICFVGNVDINAEMIKRGLAWAFARYSQAGTAGPCQMPTEACRALASSAT